MSSLIWFIIAGAFAAPTPPARVHLRPDPAVIAQWTERLFEQDTLWIFDEARDLEVLMARTRLDLALRSELRALVKDQLTREEYNRAYSFFEVPTSNHTYLLVPESLWDRLPPEFLRAVWLDHSRRHLSDGSSFQFRGWPRPARVARPLLKFQLRMHARDGKAAKVLADLAVFFNDRWRIPVVPATWRYFNEIARDAVVESFLTPIPEREGLSLAELPKMPPFVADRVGRYAQFSGANCFQLAREMLAPATTPARPTGFFALETLLERKYRTLNSGESLEPGDLMVYRRPWEPGGSFMVYNVSLVVDPGQIVTKNGLNKFCPYVIEDLIHDYVRNQRVKPFSLTHYRHRDEGRYRRACEGDLRSVISESY